jgi:chemotaxis family two-component system response regulator Rcp1
MNSARQPNNQPVVRILLAEDNDGDIFLVRRALEKRGLAYQLTVARNGEEALELLERAENSPSSEAPKLILLDLNLPKIDGAQVLARIRKTNAFNSTPVIVLTSSDSPKDRESALALGANVYFRKPTDLQSFMHLGDVVDRVLQDRPPSKPHF